MAERGKPLDARTMMRIIRLRAGLSVRRVARLTGTSPVTVLKYSRVRNTT